MGRLTVQDWGRMSGNKAMYKQEVFEVKNLLVHECGVLFIGDGYEQVKADECKPILRMIEDMTEYEQGVYCSLYGQEQRNTELLIDVSHVKAIDYLDSIGIDIRGWIDKGLAIDAKEINQDKKYQGGDK